MDTLEADILNTMLFRLLFGTQDDRYEAETAPHLLRGLHRLDEESGRVTMRLRVMEAVIDLEEQRNLHRATRGCFYSTRP